MHPKIYYFGAVPNQTVDPLLSWTSSHLSSDFAFVGSDYIYPRSVNRQARVFVEALGGRILLDEYFPLGCEDFSAFFQNVKSQRGRRPPVIFSTLVGKSIPAFYKQHFEKGLRTAIVSPITSEVELSCVGLEAAAGHYFTDGHLENPEGSTRDGFAAEYRRRFGDKPINGMMAAVYEAILLLGRYFLRAGAGNGGGARVEEKAVAYLRAPQHETPNGRIVLDPQNQHAWVWTRVARVGRQGEIETVWTSPGPTPPRPHGDRPSEPPIAGRLAHEAAPGDPFGELIGRSETFTKCVRMARIAARTSAPILLTGETGTGKEVFARSIHGASERSGGPFVAVNCAAMPAELIESELFGYAPGAFTGARREGRKGKFELAAQGTLFLDEITELSLELQAVLLRALQDKKVVPVGSSREIETDVRVIAATNRNVAPELEPSSVLRSDLHFRLNVFRIDIPPLRSRPEDIPQLTEAVLDRLNQQNGRTLRMTRDAMDAVTRYAWPGNVRELENAIERAFHVCGNGPLDGTHLPAVVAAARSGAPSTPGSPTPDSGGAPFPPTGANGPGDEERFHQERQVISRAILASGHNISRASRVLGISRSTLYRRLKALNIVVPDSYAPRRSAAPPVR
jgi:DNA-binding NtrC family response regulator